MCVDLLLYYITSNFYYTKCNIVLLNGFITLIPWFLTKKLFCILHLDFLCFAVGSVLIFVTRKLNSEELATNLKSRDFKGELFTNHMLLYIDT
jgi:uncharacterized membrane protein